MYNEKYLKRLGFTEFEHLHKAKRDMLRRLFAVTYVENSCFTIRLVYLNNIWEIDCFSFEGDENIYVHYFSTKNPSLQNIVNKLFSINIQSIGEEEEF